MSVPVREVMTPRERLVTVHEGASLEEAKNLMHRHRLERVLVVTKDFRLAGLMTVKDITKATDHPLFLLVKVPKSALKSSLTQALTLSSSTPLTVTPRVFLTA